MNVPENPLYKDWHVESFNVVPSEFVSYGEKA